MKLRTKLILLALAGGVVAWWFFFRRSVASAVVSETPARGADYFRAEKTGKTSTGADPAADPAAQQAAHTADIRSALKMESAQDVARGMIRARDISPRVVSSGGDVRSR